MGLIRRFWLLVTLFAVGLSAFSAPARAAEATRATPRFEKVPCRFDKPRDYKIECGDLAVPENRTNPNSRTIKIHVAIVKAKNAKAEADPVIYLEGGPGGQSLITMEFTFARWFSKFGVKRDFIMFDQRGVGFSEPHLECRELNGFYYDDLKQAISPRESLKKRNEALWKCAERLRKQGIDLNGYNSAENAADVADLRAALGIDTWNLYGISYGTRLALTVMRDHPEGLRSVVLDSTVPPQAALYADIPTSANRVFEKLFADCAADRRCTNEFPRLKTVFKQVFDRLNKKPVAVNVPFRGEDVKVMVTGNRIMDAMFSMFYQTDAIPYLPRLIWDAHKGDYEYWGRLILEENLGGVDNSSGFYFSVQCSEEVPFIAKGEMDNADSKFPNQNGTFEMGNYYTICQKWGVDARDRLENEPVVSDIPTLVMAGQYDPITPPSYGSMAAKTLKNSYFFEFPGVGHGASVSGLCPRSIMQAFLDQPTRKPNSNCMRRMEGPKFILR